MKARRTGAIAIFIGLLGLVTLMRNPRFQTFHAVDILQLLASGMCFGIGLTAILGRLKPRE